MKIINIIANKVGLFTLKTNSRNLTSITVPGINLDIRTLSSSINAFTNIPEINEGTIIGPQFARSPLLVRIKIASPKIKVHKATPSINNSLFNLISSKLYILLERSIS